MIDAIRTVAQARPLGALAALLLCATLAACGGDSNDSSSNSSPPPATNSPEATKPLMKCAP